MKKFEFNKGTFGVHSPKCLIILEKEFDKNMHELYTDLSRYKSIPEFTYCMIKANGENELGTFEEYLESEEFAEWFMDRQNSVKLISYVTDIINGNKKSADKKSTTTGK